MGKGHCDEKIRSEGRCRLCLRDASVRALTRHRIVPGAFGGRYVPENVVPLCRPCHDDVDNRDRLERRRARRMLRAVLWPVEVAHAKRQRFWRSRLHPFPWGFEVEYPRPPRELVLERRRDAA